MPPSLKDWLPEGHLARFVNELVDDVFDLDPFLSAYREVRSSSPGNPCLMTQARALLLPAPRALVAKD